MCVYVCVCVWKPYLALNKQKELICHKPQASKQPTYHSKYCFPVRENTFIINNSKFKQRIIVNA